MYVSFCGVFKVNRQIGRIRSKYVYIWVISEGVEGY
jgi:hypothetical protein